MPRTAAEIIVIVGPTASGKSAHAVALAHKLNGEIISADSRQVYRELDIGTGKVTAAEMEGIPHYMLDVADPRYRFSVFEYVHMAQPIMEDIVRRGKIAIICGGTGFYIDALLGRISLSSTAPNPSLRAELDTNSTGELFVRLQALDPTRAETIDRHNRVRLIRALEIATNKGAEISLPKQKQVQWIGLLWSTSALRTRVHNRLLARMNGGMLEEAVRLHQNGLSYERMHELGLEYRFLAEYLQGRMNMDPMVHKLETAIWHYARRQMTYWRRNAEIQWIEQERIA